MQPVRAISPRVWTPGEGTLRQAWDAAREKIEPIVFPLAFFTDDRGFSLMNLMQGVVEPSGQVNFSVQYPGVVKAWHAHRLQTDFWVCVQGHLKVGCYRESDHTAWAVVTGERRPAIVIIPPPLWHGAATVGPTPASLMYYLTHAFNPHQPDENRRAWDSVVGFPWAPENK